MKKILALITLAIVLVGCTPTETTPDVEEDTTTPDVVVEDTTTTTPDVVVEQDDPLPEDYDLNSDISISDEVKNKEDKTVADCESVVDEGLKERCINDVLLFMALESYDISICDQIKKDTAEKGCIARVEQAKLYKDEEVN